MSAAWTTIGALALGTIAIKATGPVLFGSRDLPAALAGFISLLAPALLAALVAVDTFAGHPHQLVVSASVAGLGAAAVGVRLRLPIIVVVLLAAAVTALARAL